MSRFSQICSCIGRRQRAPFYMSQPIVDISIATNELNFSFIIRLCANGWKEVALSNEKWDKIKGTNRKNATQRDVLTILNRYLTLHMLCTATKKERRRATHAMRHEIYKTVYKNTRSKCWPACYFPPATNSPWRWALLNTIDNHSKHFWQKESSSFFLLWMSTKLTIFGVMNVNTRIAKC